MGEDLEDSVKSNRQFKRAIIVFAIVEFIVIIFVVAQVAQK